MKRKWIVIIAIAAVFTVAVILLLLFSGRTVLQQQVETTIIKQGSMVQQYKTTGTVCGRLHSYYFTGTIESCFRHEGDHVSSGSVLLKYRDVRNRVKTLKSSVSGYVTMIGSDHVEVCDSDYRVTVRLNQQQVSSMNIGDQALFTANGNKYLLTVDEIRRYGYQRDDEICFDVIMTIDDCEGLLANQQGNVTMELRRSDNVLTVDRRALLEDDRGSFLLQAGWIDDPGSPEDYRIDVTVISVNENEAQVSGIALENLEVCILSEQLRKLVYDQAD